ncbi:nitrogen fixation protein nifs [Mycoplasmopsis columbina SF7]|uniref:Nitrogen fixation protein nifs n=1 Tax=Mycoplasmopsis columbina SF7 TaxID=1037410 RepID=F9UJW8_9BACT|nr:aminotransferase class V-fold PLP-dependent enzyme [Mycoplasmopsis columbina]EGV00314.1 nitrogen fixation protein nifs [Mycoplasmopsis columbina SF7]
MNKIREHFPLLEQIVYFDNSALTQKPLRAIQAEYDFYTKYAVSTRSSETKIGIKNAEVINNVRQKVRTLLQAKDEDKISFTSGTTDSLNKIALMVKHLINKDDEIILSIYNHSSNIGPWIRVAEEKGAKIIFTDQIIQNINKKTKIVALSQVSNSFEQKVNLEEVYKRVIENNAYLINDAAQAIISESVSFANCDAIAFSANKFYGPTGFGVLAFNHRLAQQVTPAFVGGGSVAKVDTNACLTIKNDLMSYEPGTPNLAAFHMFNASLDFFNEFLGYQKTQQHLRDLTNYLWDELAKIKNLTLYNSRNNHILLFNVKNIPAQDVAHYLATKNIYVRSGIFCAQYLKNIRDENAYVRVSLGIYNTKEECDYLVKTLKEGGDFLVI